MNSVVSTVFNDRFGLERFFAAMAIQSRMPDEIVIVDAGSLDGSWELLQAESMRKDPSWNFIIFQEPRCNVARGRNLAIEAATCEIIISTDIGCNWDTEWIEGLVAPLEQNLKYDLVIGSWAVQKSHLSGPWALTEWALKGDQRLEATAESYSSSRSISYRKRCWEALGKYPEDLTLAGDDAVFHYLIEKAMVPRVGAPVVRCWWHRHTTLKGFLKEAFRYGLGDGEAGIRKRDVALIGGRIGMEMIALATVIICLLPIFPLGPWLGVLGFCLAAGSIALKLLKMRGAVGRLRTEGVSYPLLRLVTFTYSIKLQWLRGFFIGLQRGAVHCRNCRRRLQDMTPTLYRQRLASLSAEH
jgi:glycosyltransferase involved in cell wall biosynthesis